MASAVEEKFAEKSSLEPERAFRFHVLLLNRMQFVPESEAARDDQSDKKANQKEPAISRERDQENRYYCDGDDETRRSPQAESRAAAGFRFHKFYSTAGSQTLSLACRGLFYLAEKLASEGPLSLGGFDSIFGCLLCGYYSIHYVPPKNSALS